MTFNGFLFVVTLLAADYMMFQGEPCKEEDYCNAFMAVQASMEKYDPKYNIKSQ
ncbi:hypothetical protein HNR33_003608 [Brassicibacter mesophilus]